MTTENTTKIGMTKKGHPCFIPYAPAVMSLYSQPSNALSRIPAALDIYNSISPDGGIASPDRVKVGKDTMDRRPQVY